VSGPGVLVCAGGGGVGKTTTAAALALALARRGHRTLVVTVDPARRLAQAMGIEIDEDVHGAHLEPEVEGLLFALMPEPRRSTRTFVEVLFHDEPEALARMLANPVYATLGDALAGIHELVSLMLVARAVSDASYDYVVIDTAPSRYGLDFVAYPGRLAALLEGRAMSWFGGLAQRAAAQDDAPPKEEGRLVAWGKKRVEAAIGRILDPQTLRDVAALFAELTLVRERFAGLARASERLLLGDSARYLLVATPTGAAEADVRYISRKLTKLRQRPSAILVNRADEGPPPWAVALGASDLPTPPMREALEIVQRECAARQRAGDQMIADFARTSPGTPALRLPTVEARDPSLVVRALADVLAEHMAAFGA